MTLKHLAETLDSLMREAPKPFGTANAVHPLFGPFLARSILEVSCSSLIARLDPFRVLTLAELQAHPDYQHDKKVAAAIQWQGDVLAECKSALWTADRKPEQMSRALLGDYLEAIVWRPAFERYLDAAAAQTLAVQASSLRQYQLSEFIPRTRALAAKTYSSASKGIHHEFLLPHTSYYDESTLKVLVEDAVRVAADLGVVASHCEHICFSVSSDEALAAYAELV